MSDVLLNSCGLPLLSSERSWREDEEFKKRQQAREETRRREEEQRAAAAVNWYTAVDGRINEHLQNWLWNAIDERIKQQIEIAQKGLVDATGDVFGLFRAQLRKEFESAIDKLRDEFRVGIGRLPIAKTWDPDEVCYRGDVVIRDGAVFQALKDTGKTPAADHPDWILLARAGRDGCDGHTPNFRGRYDAYQGYQRFDVIEFDGSSFVALYNDPGIPGDPGWQILSKNGSRGPVGDTGPRGRKGEWRARRSCSGDRELDNRHHTLSRDSHHGGRANWNAARPSPAIRKIL